MAALRGEACFRRPPAASCRSSQSKDSKVAVMNQLALQVLIVMAFGALCFGCGYLTAFIVTRNKWRDETMRRGGILADWQTGMGRATATIEVIECHPAASRHPGLSKNSREHGRF